MINKWLLKEWIKMKCEMFYGAGYIAGFSVATWRFWTNDTDEDLHEKEHSLKIAENALQRTLDCIDKDESSRP